MEVQQPAAADLQRQIDVLKDQVAANRGEIDALVAGAEVAVQRADASEAREELARRRAEARDDQADRDRLRIDVLEFRADVDRELILELQEAGVVRADKVAQLQRALETSRMIGAAIGIVMARRIVTQDEAFTILKQASQHSNRKLRDLAEELVLTGDTGALPAA